MKSSSCSVYHISRKGMPLSEGYIGISSNPTNRWKSHLNSPPNEHFKNAMNIYSDIEFRIIAVCPDRDYALFLEEKLRPNGMMGWNWVAGGGNPPIHYGDDNPMRDPRVAAKLTGEGNGMYNRKGKDHHLFGVKRPEHSLRMSGENHPMYGKKGLSGDKNGMYDSTLYHFKHKDGTERHCTQHNLRTEFGLHQGNLSIVTKQKRKSTGGWIILWK